MLRKITILILILIFSVALVDHIRNANENENINLLSKIPEDVNETGLIGGYGNVKVAKATQGYIIYINNSKFFLNASKAYFFPWGFVVIEKTYENLTIPVYIYTRTTTTTYRRIEGSNDTIKGVEVAIKEGVENVTEVVEVTKIKAYSYNGSLLWEHKPQPPYKWGAILHYPRVLFSNNSEVFFIAEIPQGIRGNSPDLPPLLRNVTQNCLYVYGERGLIQKFVFSNLYRATDVFLISARNYTAFGIEIPYGDNTPHYAEVLIFQGSKVIFRKSFVRSNPSVLMDLLTGKAKVLPNGYVEFGVFDGVGVYHNGTFKYIPRN
ncbi:hypothetical protein [Pyrococcus horikoshii]|uniref:Uncharacterized protein n=1 Tax=Pyrococcus horikoshii (strain ATCC 700860 / DSM 12428 / JCM 9974 / NBRC 100139 / OT-3) TaxID=70601 RepID=O58797_PYRHO|nr:hypothetical protein [Pyrococcus horikoshii]BAA30169.1 320aa long hypothetical protein [Pyrococcus horikoshii OT3]